MCIVVNDQEKCGFKQVSTDFALNYITDQTVANQASQTNITHEKDCTSGTANGYALLNPNLQSGVSAAANPDINSQGIVRVCSTNNPGSNVGSGRWAAVGYCDDPSLKCWIDEQSIKAAINMNSIQNSTLSAVNKYNQDVLLDEKAWFLSGEFSTYVKTITDDLTSNDVTKLNDAISVTTDLLNEKRTGKKIFFDYQKAYLTLLKAEAYGKLAESDKTQTDLSTASAAASVASNVDCVSFAQDEQACNSHLECSMDSTGSCVSTTATTSTTTTATQTTATTTAPSLLGLYILVNSKYALVEGVNIIKTSNFPVSIKQDSSWGTDFNVYLTFKDKESLVCEDGFDKQGYCPVLLDQNMNPAQFKIRVTDLAGKTIIESDKYTITNSK